MDDIEQSVIVVHSNPKLDGLVSAWLSDAKSRSEKTYIAYVKTIGSFRGFLQMHGFDLDAERGYLRLMLQEWAKLPRLNGEDVAPATYNQRLAIVSSFYTYALNNGFIERHPTKGMKPLKNEDYQWAQPIPAEHIEASLAAIDTHTERGKRDHAFLMVALGTGRRLSELRDMDTGHIELTGRIYTVTFPHAKGGKVMRDELEPRVWRSLKRYLTALYGEQWDADPTAPVWVSFSDRSRGHRLGRQAVADICTRRLGISKVHALRHTWAYEMERTGAPISLIQAKLGHSSLETTGRYLRALTSAHNPYAGKLMDKFEREGERDGHDEA